MYLVSLIYRMVNLRVYAGLRVGLSGSLALNLCLSGIDQNEQQARIFSKIKPFKNT